MTDKTAPRYPGTSPQDWRTREGRLTRKAARYLNHRTAKHYQWIADNYGAREANQAPEANGAQT